MLIANTNAAVSYTGCFVIATGLYVAVGLPLAWLPGNKPRYGKRAFATGLQLTLGNTAGIVMPFLFTSKDSPGYRKGYGVSIAAVGVSSVIFTGMTVYYRGINRGRSEGREDWKVEGKTEDEVNEMGDKSPRYVYAL